MNSGKEGGIHEREMSPFKKGDENMRIDFHQLRLAIRQMTPRSKLFHVLKEELGSRGYWKNHPRDNPEKGYQTSRTATQRTTRKS